MAKRKDTRGRVLKENESERKQGGYQYRWREHGQRYTVYAPTLEELRKKEDEIFMNMHDSIRHDSKTITLNDAFNTWSKVKKGLKDNTLQGYITRYNRYVKNDIGMRHLSDLHKSDIMAFYIHLVEEEHLKVSTITTIQAVLHPVLELALEDGYIRKNPADNALKELNKSTEQGKSEQKIALTIDQEKAFLDFLKGNTLYHHWYPLFVTMLKTGLRVGEIISLTWDDIDFEKSELTVNKTLVQYRNASGKYVYSIHTPKTKLSKRVVPILPVVKEALLQEKEHQTALGLTCQSVIDDVSNFVFLNRCGRAHDSKMLNIALTRIVKKINEQYASDMKDGVASKMLPHISCHILRHTFATRCAEAHMPVEVLQRILGHSNIKTTMEVYVDVQKDYRDAEFRALDAFYAKNSLN